MKKFVFVLSLVLILALSSVTAFADEIIINIDSVKVEFNDDLGFPFIDENSRTQVPFRATLEKYGAQIDWNNESRIAIATKGDIVVEVPIDENYIVKNGEKTTVDTAARIVNGRTYLPIRAVLEAFGSEVQWDSQLNTVVITTVPVDAKAIYSKAAEKSYAWKNYDVKATVDLSMNIPDDTGSVQKMDMSMNMDMTIFMNPFKAKIKAAMPVAEEFLQPVMEMYMTVDKDSYTTYMGMSGDTDVNWMKQTIKDETLIDLMKNDEEAIKKSKELAEKYTEDVKYFGKYTDEAGRTLLRLQYTMSGDIYKELLGDYSELMPEPANEQEAMTVEMIKNIANADLGDLKYIIYIDEATGEIVKMEMDLGNMIVSMLSGMTGVLGEMPPEAAEIINSLEAKMVMEILNINNAKDFEIPKEALNAPDADEMLKELEQSEPVEEKAPGNGEVR
jgi:molybdopterin converting factor small subunit